MLAPRDDRRRRLLIELSDAELTKYLDTIRGEVDRLADLLQRDRAALDGGPSSRGPLGKLRPRIARSRARWNEYRARQSAAEVEVTRRRLFGSSDWDEPTLTDAERLIGRIDAEDRM